jgi:hypothetical protein
MQQLRTSSCHLSTGLTGCDLHRVPVDKHVVCNLKTHMRNACKGVCYHDISLLL